MWLLFLTLILFAILIKVERNMPFLKDPPAKVLESYRTNFKLFLFNEIALAIFSVESIYLLVDKFSGHGLLSSMAEGPVKYLLAFVLMDLTLYLWHRSEHVFKFLWGFHQIHHSDACVNVTTAVRFHTLALILAVAVKALFFIIMGLSATSVLYFEGIMTVFVILQHTNITFPYEQRIGKIFIVPHLHRLHHSRAFSQRDRNFGIVFSFWDRIFATHLEALPEGIGLAYIDHASCVQLLRMGFINAVDGISDFFRTTRRTYSAVNQFLHFNN
ncbi:sterol desaturase family protein [Methylobacter luteus]|uniref:sterol desaturase family protein n=1 Tax=Methylobacter luteus TaxID=415 RepID=UPI00041C82E5|nr:sterol desaturase family protein [Methylobacter luteus]